MGPLAGKFLRDLRLKLKCGLSRRLVLVQPKRHESSYFRVHLLSFCQRRRGSRGLCLLYRSHFQRHLSTKPVGIAMLDTWSMLNFVIELFDEGQALALPCAGAMSGQRGPFG